MTIGGVYACSVVLFFLVYQFCLSILPVLAKPSSEICNLSISGIFPTLSYCPNARNKVAKLKPIYLCIASYVYIQEKQASQPII